MHWTFPIKKLKRAKNVRNIKLKYKKAQFPLMDLHKHASVTFFFIMLQNIIL